MASNSQKDINKQGSLNFQIENSSNNQSKVTRQDNTDVSGIGVTDSMPLNDEDQGNIRARE